MRQVARLFRQSAMSLGANNKSAEGWSSAGKYADNMATMIEVGSVDERDWNFLCLIADKLVLNQSPESLAPSAESQ